MRRRLRSEKRIRRDRASARRSLQRCRKKRSRRSGGSADQRGFVVNRKLRVRKPTLGHRRLEAPAALDFAQSAEDTLSFLRDIRAKVFEDQARKMLIDHRPCKFVTPGAALVLIAELTRVTEYSKRCALHGHFSADPRVRSLLGATGYLEYFGIPWKRAPGETREFLKHYTDRRSVGRIAKELVTHFAAEARFEAVDVKALGRAIIECMDNVAAHAYPTSVSEPFLRRQWWLLGYRDPVRHELSFCFYDQGVGIPQTIRTRLRDRLPLVGPTDCELIVRGVTEGYSSTQEPSRGRGLLKLKAFIVGARSGELMIVTDRSHCIFRRGCAPVTSSRSVGLAGTLIVWRVTLDHG